MQGGSVEVLVRRGRSGIDVMDAEAEGVLFCVPYVMAYPDGRVDCLTPFGWTGVDLAEFVRATKPVPPAEARKELRKLDGQFSDAATGGTLAARLVRRVNWNRYAAAVLRAISRKSR
jgi:hypothetical protein